MKISKRQAELEEMIEAAKEDAHYRALEASERAMQGMYANEEQLTGEAEHLRDCEPSSMAEIDRDDANLAGRRRPNQAWICSDRDVWYANPYYVGAPQPHPEHEYHD